MIVKAIRITFLIALEIPLLWLWVVEPVAIWAKIGLGLGYIIAIALLAASWSKARAFLEQRKGFH